MLTFLDMEIIFLLQVDFFSGTEVFQIVWIELYIS